MSAFQDITELSEVLRETLVRREQLQEEMKTLDLSRHGEKTLREMLDGLDKILARLGDITHGIGRANEAQAKSLEDEQRVLRHKLKNAYLELERSLDETKRQREEEDLRRKGEDEAYRDLETALREALGPDAARIAEQSKAIVSREMAGDGASTEEEHGASEGDTTEEEPQE